MGKKYDPYEINEDDLKSFQSENKRGSSGRFCPKRNSDMSGDCGVCNYIDSDIYSRKYPDGHPARQFGSDKKAKQNIFFNIVLEDNPSKFIILEVGSKVGNIIIEKAQSKWRDIIHPHAGKGREIEITKTKDSGYPAYPVDAELEKADWEIPQEVLDSLPDLSKIKDMITNGELTEDNYMKISSLKHKESLRFRICPPWDIDNNRRWAASVWRHWGVSEDHISGEATLNWKTYVEDEEEDEELKLPEKKKEEDVPWEGDKSQDNPNCFGKEVFYDPKDEDCKDTCPVFKKCGRAVLEG